MLSMFDWKNRTCMQRFALIVAIAAMIIVLLCLISNIVTTVRAADETWFTRCTKCKRFGGDKECGDKCCSNCTWKDGFFFYTLRAFSMLFCLLAMAAEVPMLTFFRKLFHIFQFAWGRGLLQIFVGFLTLTGNLAPDNEDTANIVAGIGWIAIGLGIVHLFLSCLCFNEYSEMSEEMKEEQRRHRTEKEIAKLQKEQQQHNSPHGQTSVSQASPTGQQQGKSSYAI